MQASILAAKTVVTRFAGRAGLQLTKHLPEILTGLGVVGGVASVVTAAKSTMELEANTAEGRRLVEGHKKLREERSEEEYSKQQYAKDMIISYARLAEGYIKTYAIPAALGAASITAFLGAVGILKQRNAAITAAYNMLDAAYKSYKKSVVEVVGEEKEAEIANNQNANDVICETDREKMSQKELEKLAKKLEKKGAPGQPSPYAVWFDRTNPNWDATLENTMFFLKCTQNFMNDKLSAKGHLFTNDVYRALGMQDTKPGSVTGWVKNNRQGDGFVDLGLEKLQQQVDSAFGNNLKDGFWIELNVDGVIFDLLEG